jgi:hypothetical protein
MFALLKPTFSLPLRPTLLARVLRSKAPLPINFDIPADRLVPVPLGRSICLPLAIFISPASLAFPIAMNAAARVSYECGFLEVCYEWPMNICQKATSE